MENIYYKSYNAISTSYKTSGFEHFQINSTKMLLPVSRYQVLFDCINEIARIAPSCALLFVVYLKTVIFFGSQTTFELKLLLGIDERLCWTMRCQLHSLQSSSFVSYSIVIMIVDHSLFFRKFFLNLICCNPIDDGHISSRMAAYIILFFFFQKKYTYTYFFFILLTYKRVECHRYHQ